MTRQTPVGRTPDAAILVVDDTPARLQQLTELLFSAGYEVRPATKPEVAIAAALDSPPDLALLDIRMSSMDGFEVCRRLKADIRTADVPVIFISEADDEAAVLRGFEAGGVDFLTTPFHDRIVLARVATHVRLARVQGDLESERNLLDKRVRERTAQLQASEYLARSMFEQAAVGMAYVAPDGRFLQVNRKFCEIVGYSETELLERGFPDITHPDDRTADMEVLNRLFAGDLHTEVREKRYVRKDGTFGWAERSAAVVRAPGTAPWVVTVVHDIDARKRAEQAILVYQQRLKELASELARAEERERRNMATELHDQVGQSLSAMRALLEAARKGTADTRVDARLEEVSECLRNAIRSTRDIMSDLSSPTLNELGLSAALSEWLREEVAARSGLDIRFRDDGEPKPLGADARGIVFRSVRELVTNVVKHARASKVTVTLERVGSALVIVVEDDGVGMPGRAGQRGKPGEGGFGLFSIDERMSDLGGALTIEKAAGGGVRASIRVPLEDE